MSSDIRPDISVVIVSFNTGPLTRECLQTLEANAGGVRYEAIVVDNVSCDGSPDMIEREFPEAKLIRSSVNLGFAAANNRAFPLARGRYIVLLNSDAFVQPGALPAAVEKMDRNPHVGLAGARLVGRDGSWQPSARMFPSLLNDFLTLSGLAAARPRSRFFGRLDRTWAPADQAAEVDWVPGAFSILRREVLEKVGPFDERFFLYYEEVELCRRIKAAGYSVLYWPEIVVVHLGGESSKTVKRLTMSSSGAQLTLWRMRSALLYYRKHHGAGVWPVARMEWAWHKLRAWKNRGSADPARAAKAEESATLSALMERAWSETRGGRIAPPTPW